jgi:hypothetical protein
VSFYRNSQRFLALFLGCCCCVAEGFCAAEVEVDETAGRVTLSKIFDWCGGPALFTGCCLGRASKRVGGQAMRHHGGGLATMTNEPCVCCIILLASTSPHLADAAHAPTITPANRQVRRRLWRQPG